MSEAAEHPHIKARGTIVEHDGHAPAGAGAALLAHAGFDPASRSEGRESTPTKRSPTGASAPTTSRSSGTPKPSRSLSRMSARRRLSFSAALVAALVAALTAAALPAASAAKSMKLPPGIVTFAVNQPDRIFLAGVTGGHTCTFASGGVTSFGWSPDGSRLAFSRVDDGPPDTADLYVTNSTGGHAGGKFRELTNNGKDGTFDRLPAWSPDGRSIAFTRASGPEGSRRSVIVRMRSDGTRLREVASPPVVDGVQTTDYWPSFSPDGKYVAFVRERATAADLFVAGPRGAVRALTKDGKSARDGYGWAPTGHSIVFVRGTHLEDAGPLRGGRPRRAAYGDSLTIAFRSSFRSGHPTGSASCTSSNTVATSTRSRSTRTGARVKPWRSHMATRSTRPGPRTRASSRTTSFHRAVRHSRTVSMNSAASKCATSRPGTRPCSSAGRSTTYLSVGSRRRRSAGSRPDRGRKPVEADFEFLRRRGDQRDVADLAVRVGEPCRSRGGARPAPRAPRRGRASRRCS